MSDDNKNTTNDKSYTELIINPQKPTKNIETTSSLVTIIQDSVDLSNITKRNK